jgi:hypothetical protein
VTFREVPAALHHAPLISRLMRPADVIEVMAQTGLPPRAAIAQAIELSPRYARAVLCDLKPIAVYGLANLTVLGATAQVWCFGTRFIDDYPRAFARHSIRALGRLYRHASTLTNYVDCADERAARWLVWLGAEFVLQPKPLNGRLFDQFVLSQRGKQCQQG